MMNKLSDGFKGQKVQEQVRDESFWAAVCR